MAGRKKTTRKKTATRKTTTRKSASPGRSATRKKAATSTRATARAKQAPATRKKAATARASAAPAGGAVEAAARSAAAESTAEAIARRIVRMTTHPETLDLRAIYAPACSSREATGDLAEGIEAIERKFEAFAAMIREQRWKARSTWTRGSRICIEWQAELETADGRSIRLEEVAVHELKGGKIVAERFYYDPAQLLPLGIGERGATERPPPGPAPVVPDLGGTSPIDPLDL